MKKSILIIAMVTISGLGFSQVSNQTTTATDSVSVSIVKEMGYDPKVLGDKTAESLNSKSQEEKEWFKNTFIHKRGQFKIPSTPIVDPYSER